MATTRLNYVDESLFGDTDNSAENEDDLRGVDSALHCGGKGAAFGSWVKR